MSLKCGIVGLPNVGKSTLFSALSGIAVEAANYPFCTIEPNIAVVEVPDERLKSLTKLVTTEKVIPAAVQFVDIAGLVRGASKGEGLGNQFLGNIRSVDAIVQVMRCFESGDIIHVEGKVDPIADLETIETELALSDLEIVEKRASGLDKKIRAQEKDAKELKPVIDKALVHLSQGHALRTVSEADLSSKEREKLKELNLLTLKPQIWVANIAENEVSDGSNKWLEIVKARAAKEGVEVVPICASIESEVSQLPESERAEFLQELNIKERGLSKLIRATYHLLGLRTYFTVGPKEIRAWTFKKGALAPEAAGVIHTDFEKGFIRAETYHFEDLVSLKNEKSVRENGKMRMEGKDYPVKDGDIMHFHFTP